jgi:ribonuclease D
MNVVLTEAKLITRLNDLKKLAAHFSQQPVLAVDTESNSLFAYQEKVCLVQFSTPFEDYLVDPLAIHDLSPLGPIFADAGIVKVFHAAEYDLICLRRDFGFQFANLFDTMQALRILGRQAFGLGSILEAEYGIKVDKRQQRANWGQRPLPQHLLEYARMDTRYLIRLREQLVMELKAADRLELANEDFQRLCKINDTHQEDEPTVIHNISGGRLLPPRQYTVLLQLSKYREQVARQIDKPLFKVIGDKTLLAIAEACPKNLDQLKQIEGMTKGQIDRHGKALLQAVQQGLESKPVSPPRGQRADERMINRLEKLREWRKKTAQALKVESDVVLPRDLMVMLAEQPPHTHDELAQIFQDVTWRFKKYGEQILNLLDQDR